MGGGVGEQAPLGAAGERGGRCSSYRLRHHLHRREAGPPPLGDGHLSGGEGGQGSLCAPPPRTHSHTPSPLLQTQGNAGKLPYRGVPSSHPSHTHLKPACLTHLHIPTLSGQRGQAAVPRRAHRAARGQGGLCGRGLPPAPRGAAHQGAGAFVYGGGRGCSFAAASCLHPRNASGP